MTSRTKTTSTKTSDRGALLTKRDVAERLGVHVKTIDAMIREGEIVAHKLTSRPKGPVRIFEVDFNDYLSRRPKA